MTKNYVAFVGWDSHWTEARTKKYGKIHLGILNENKSVRSLCRCHDTYSLFAEHRRVVFNGRVDIDRVCKFCYQYSQIFWLKLQKMEPAVELEYYLFDLTGKEPYVSTPKGKALENMLMGRPELLDTLNKPGSKLWLIKGHLVEVEAKVRKIVDSVKIKE